MSDKSAEVSRLLTPTVESLGLELLGVEYLPGSGNAVLRLYIDVPFAESQGEGARSVTIEDCEAVSREVSGQLDVEDPISSHYTLEVSSPGLDRPLFLAEHFARFAGESAKVTLRLPQDGRRRLTGRILRLESEMVVFDIDGNEFSVAVDNIEKARLVPDWAALGLAPTKPAAGKGAAAKKNSNKNPTPKPATDRSSQAE